MGAILWPMISWLLRGVVIKSVLFAALFAVLSMLIPFLLSYLLGITPQTVQDGLGSMSSSTLYFFKAFGLDVGIPVVLSAHATRFLIRRIPFIG
jgi:Protein of unknown function (DUF2523)